MSGHLFVLHGDLTRLHCDAWLAPCGRNVHLTESFRRMMPAEVLPRLDAGLGKTLPGWPDARAAAFPDWRWDAPVPILTRVGSHRAQEVTWYCEGVAAFLDEAERLVPTRRRTAGRARPLVGLPVVGTGFGGAAHKKGHILQGLVPFLAEEVRRRDLDVALVTARPVDFAGAQLARSGLPDWQWEGLDARQLRLAADLAERARRGRLALFMGAGLGAAVGLPDWDGLLQSLARPAGVAPDELEAHNHLDRATILEKRLTKEGLEAEVVKRLRTPWRSVAHLLLVSLPAREAVTLNYDDVFEGACAEAKRGVSVLPYEPADRGERWLLKLHGCVSHPEDIVLRRQDYIRFEDRRRALAGVVQGLLLTRHLLFVGFSLGDDNFHRIADAVQKTSRHGRDCFGTALMSTGGRLLAELWEPRVRIADFGKGAEAWRGQEIFLDRVAHLSTTLGSHLMDDDFAGLLGEADLRLKGLLTRLQRDADPEVRRSDGWVRVEEILRALGGR